MAVEEGFRRIRLIGKSILAVGLLLLAVALIGFLIDAVFHSAPFALGFVPLGIFLSAFAAAILLGAWIAEGFCEPRQTPREEPGAPRPRAAIR
ncbi:MAG TPA: hypothetical protein VHX37_02235 [Acidobacteriaceae bacterium]|jgi:uncharacterized membrane protein|nr:hypothetical protein [Acidobacteriaceae bacterium]